MICSVRYGCWMNVTKKLISIFCVHMRNDDSNNEAKWRVNFPPKQPRRNAILHIFLAAVVSLFLTSSSSLCLHVTMVCRVNFSSPHTSIRQACICELWCEYSDDTSLCQILIGTLPLWHAITMIFHFLFPSRIPSFSPLSRQTEYNKMYKVISIIPSA